MIKIIGIGGCGNNILEFIKKQDFTNIENEYEFISIKNDSDIDSIEYKEEDKIFTISGFGGQTASKLTIDLTKKIVDNNGQVKNMIIFPFSIETTINKAIKEIEELSSVHKNIEIFPNDAISNENNQNITMSELMREYDSKIFYTLTTKSKIGLHRSFIINTQKDDKVYVAIVRFWSKSFTVTIMTPKFERLDCLTSIGNIANHRYDFKNDSDKYVIDVKERSMKVLVDYIEKEKS